MKKARDILKLSERTIQRTVRSYAAGAISDREMADLLRQIYVHGASFEQAGAMTDAMVRSGKRFKYPGSLGCVIDKHSTGGVGDKVTLIFGPLAATTGLKVAKISGRALGHTGGTVDKLESIPGFRTDLPFRDFLAVIKRTGVGVMAQTGEMVPADKKIYALRDRTGMIDSVPLIAASVMSKKIAAGAKHLVLDVKAGEGAFMRDVPSATALARFMLGIAEVSKIKAVAVVSDMNQPLGHAIGNRLEVLEAYETLMGIGPSDLTELVVRLVQEAHRTFGDRPKQSDVKQHLKDGSAAAVFLSWIEAQGGDAAFVRKLASMYDQTDHHSLPHEEVTATRKGHVVHFDTRTIGELVRELEGGDSRGSRKKDLSDAGIIIHKKLGDEVKKGDTLITVFAHNAKLRARVAKMLLECVTLSSRKPAAPLNSTSKKLIKKVLQNF